MLISPSTHKTSRCIGNRYTAMKTINPQFDRSIGTIIHVSSQPIHEKKLRSHILCTINGKTVHVPLSFFKIRVRPAFIKTYHPKLTEMLALSECESDIQLHQLLSNKHVEIVKTYTSIDGKVYIFKFI